MAVRDRPPVGQGEQRISPLEAGQKETNRRLGRIEDTHWNERLTRLEDRVDRLEQRRD